MNSGEKREVIDMHVASQLMAHKRNGLTAFERLLPVFREESAMLVSQIRCAINASDAEGLHLTAHKLKGSASVLGAIEVRQISQSVMDEAQKGAYPSLECLQELEKSVEQFLASAQQAVSRRV